MAPVHTVPSPAYTKSARLGRKLIAEIDKEPRDTTTPSPWTMFSDLETQGWIVERPGPRIRVEGMDRIQQDLSPIEKSMSRAAQNRQKLQLTHPAGLEYGLVKHVDSLGNPEATSSNQQISEIENKQHEEWKRYHELLAWDELTTLADVADQPPKWSALFRNTDAHHAMPQPPRPLTPKNDKDTICINWSKTAEWGAYYDQVFDARGAVFAKRLKSPLANRQRVPPDHIQHWADVTYLQWAELTKNQLEIRKALNLVVQCNISNSTTLDVVNEVFQNTSPADKRRPVYPGKVLTLAEHGEDFAALLGTPNACGSGYLLAQHKDPDQLGWKEVKGIQIFFDPSCFLVVNFADK